MPPRMDGKLVDAEPRDGRNPALAWGRLLRVSLSASAAADAAAGLLLGAGGWPRTSTASTTGAGPWLLIAASLAVYHGGMALNDWADREVDGRLRPERPIPSGAVSSGAALGVAVLLLALGPLLAYLGAGVLPALVLAGVAVSAALYDLAGRGAWRGPLLLGLCRAGNLGAGVLAGAGLAGRAPAEVSSGPWLLVALYGLYVFAVSGLGRLEDDPRQVLPARVPRSTLGLAALALVLVPWIDPGLGHAGEDWIAQLAGPGAVALGLLGGWGLVRALAAPGAWTPDRVLRCMGLALRRLLVFTAAAAWSVAAATGRIDGLIVGLAILAGYPLSYGLRRVFPPS